MSLDTSSLTEEIRCPFTRPDGDSEQAVWGFTNSPARAWLLSVTVGGLPRSRTWACEHFGRAHVEAQEERVACLFVVAPVPVVGVLDIDEAHEPRRRPRLSEYDFQKQERF